MLFSSITIRKVLEANFQAVSMLMVLCVLFYLGCVLKKRAPLTEERDEKLSDFILLTK